MSNAHINEQHAGREPSISAINRNPSLVGLQNRMQEPQSLDKPKVKASIASHATGVVTYARSLKQKPWEENRGSAKSGGSIRKKLPGINSYDHEVEYRAHASSRVVLRLERVAGTDRIRLNDFRYMQNLSKRIEEEERRIWQVRVQDRQDEEKARYRQLVIDGILPPGADMKELLHHPIFRVNRMMKRINKLCYEPMDLPDEWTKPPRIRPTEPFEEQKRTGYLFGWHPNHYMKAGWNHLKRRVSSALIESEADVKIASVRERESRAIAMMKNFSLTSNEITAQISTEQERREYERMRTKEMQSEDEDDASFTHSETPSSQSNDIDSLTALLRKESLSQARKYLKLDKDQLQKEFGVQPPSIVEHLFEDETVR